MDKINMQTMTAILDTLTANGYTTQFKATNKGIQSLTTERIFSPEEVSINHFYRFEGESNPDDNSIVYAIETCNGEKGTLIDSYGIYNEPLITNFIKEVESIHK